MSSQRHQRTAGSPSGSPTTADHCSNRGWALTSTAQAQQQQQRRNSNSPSISMTHTSGAKLGSMAGTHQRQQQSSSPVAVPNSPRKRNLHAAGGGVHSQQQQERQLGSNSSSPTGAPSSSHSSRGLYSGELHLQKQLSLQQQQQQQQRSSPTSAASSSPRWQGGHSAPDQPHQQRHTHKQQALGLLQQQCSPATAGSSAAGTVHHAAQPERQSGAAPLAASVLTSSGTATSTISVAALAAADGDAAAAAPAAVVGGAAAVCPAAAAATASFSSQASVGQPFRGSAALPADSSSDMGDTISSDVSSSISGAAGDGSTQLSGLDIDDDDGEGSSRSEHQRQHQSSRRRSSHSSADVGSSQQQENGQPSSQQVQRQQQGTGQVPEQQQQQQVQVHLSDDQQQQDSASRRSTSLSSRSREVAAATDVARIVSSSDPDYEVPQGKMTETQVLMTHADKLHLDRYGFIVSEAEAHLRAARTKRTPGQVKREQRHVAKWRRMLGASREDFLAYASSRPQKVKRRVRKGIPDEFRGLVWQYLSGGRELMQQHPGHYAQLLTTSNEPVDLEIMRDLNRTFPNHVFFHQRQGPGQQSLFHVLRAYSAHDRQVGYVQGMGFVTAILLMYMSEEEAFWTLVALLTGASLRPPLEGMYQAGMPLLQQCLFQFQELLKQENPKLGGHLEQEGVVPSMYCTHWFNTIFAYSLPFEQLLRVWDVFLLEGMKVVFRVGIVLLSSSQEQLLGMPFEKLVAALNSRKFPVLDRHPDALMKAALRIPVSKRLELLRERYQQQVAAAEAAAAARSNGGGIGADGSREAAHYTVVPVAMGPSI